MKKDDGIMPMPIKVKTTFDELVVLAQIAGNETYMTVLKRVARHYAENLRNIAFLLDENDPQFELKHRHYKSLAYGMNNLINIIEKAKDQLNKLDKKEESLV